MAKATINVTDQDFAQQVERSEGTVLVDFWAPWCPPCRAIAPTLEAIAADEHDRLKVAKLDVDDNRATAMRFEVQSIPTLILFKNGKPVERIVGALPREHLMARITPHLGA